MVDDAGGTIDSDVVASGSFDATENFREPGIYRTGEDRYEVYVVARQFLFQPGTQEPVEIPAGSTVTFHVTSADVTHGFVLAGTNVNTMVIPGQVATVTARFDETDEYGMICHEYCGAGHHTMAGQVRVVPASEFQQAHEVTGEGRVVPAGGDAAAAVTDSDAPSTAADADTTDDDTALQEGRD
jgi:cytochrome c oxidase subunit 2